MEDKDFKDALELANQFLHATATVVEDTPDPLSLPSIFLALNLVQSAFVRRYGIQTTN